MRKPFKVMLGIIAAFMCFGAVLSLTQGKPNATDSSAAQSGSESAPSGWATSAEVFVQRWNSQTQDAYRISDLHAEGDSKRASLLGATITAGDGQLYMLATHNGEQFRFMCIATVRAALDVSMEEATALVSQVNSNMQNGPMPGYGMVEYNGYDISMQIASVGGGMTCTVMKKGS